MMAGQNGAAQVIKANAAGFATVALAVPLRLIITVPMDATAGAAGAANTIGPTVLTDQQVTLVVVDERGEIDQLRNSQDDTGK
jgi:hypothetical protein